MCLGLILAAFFFKSDFQIANFQIFQVLPKMQISPKVLRATFVILDSYPLHPRKEHWLKTIMKTSSNSHNSRGQICPPLVQDQCSKGLVQTGLSKECGTFFFTHRWVASPSQLVTRVFLPAIALVKSIEEHSRQLQHSLCLLVSGQLASSQWVVILS